MMAIANGLCRHVLCFRTVWQTTAGQLQLGGMPGRALGDMQWRMPYGAMSAANWIGMNASQYLHRYGATRELFGHIAVNARRNAGLNPNAIYREPFTLDDYFDVRMVTTPFGLYDCDVPCDGAMAVIVSAADVAGDLPHPAIRIEAAGTQITERLSWDQDTVTHEPQVIGPSTHLWTRTSLTPDDIDVALLYDGFTFNCVTWIEALGFCGFGEAKDWIDGGRTIALDGTLPLNPHGGQLSEGRTHGMGFFYEAVTQLRHDAGDRQVAERQDGGRRHRRRHPVERRHPPARRRLTDRSADPSVGDPSGRDRGSASAELLLHLAEVGRRDGAGVGDRRARDDHHRRHLDRLARGDERVELVDEVFDVDERSAEQVAGEPVAGERTHQLHVPVDVEMRLAHPLARRRTRRSSPR